MVGGQRAKLVIMSAELAVSKEFMNYPTGFHLSEQLDRIVFDECHLLSDRVSRCDTQIEESGAVAQCAGFEVSMMS